MRSPRVMSIVLYALGAGLMGWGAYLMLAGESYAAIDIAASLAGWGAFTIGLGAVVAALHRLTRAIALSRNAGPVAAPEKLKVPKEAKDGKKKVMPVFVPTRGEPAHFEPSAPEPAPKAPQAVSEAKPEAIPAPSSAAPVAEPPAAVAAPQTDRPTPEERQIRKERRAIRLGLGRAPSLGDDEPKVETPPVAAPALGGGLSARRIKEAPPALKVEPPASIAPEPASTPEPALKAEPASRPIMTVRRGPVEAPRIEITDADLAPPVAEPAPREEIDPPAPAVAEPVAVAEETAPTVELAPTVAVEPYVEPEPEPVAAIDPVTEPEPEPRPEPEPKPLPESPANQAPASEAKVPEWLARARARRQQRLDDDIEPVLGAEEPRFVRAREEPHVEQPAPALEPVASEPETASDAEPDASSRQLVSEGEHNGVVYRFYDDGSVEAQSPHGVRRFASVDELRSAVLSARGSDYAELEAAQAPVAHAAPEADPLDAALAELEGEGAPEVRIEPDDRFGRAGGR